MDELLKVVFAVPGARLLLETNEGGSVLVGLRVDRGRPLPVLGWQFVIERRFTLDDWDDCLNDCFTDIAYRWRREIAAAGISFH